MDNVGDDAPDFEGLAGFDFDGLVGGVVGQQVEAAGGGAAETLDGEFAVENGDNDLVVVGVEGAVYEEEVAGVDASTGHGGACDAQEEAGGGVLDEMLVEIEVGVDPVVGRRGKPSLNRRKM